MSSSFKPSGVITLTTDFGNKGPFLATIKGMILKSVVGGSTVMKPVLISAALGPTALVATKVTV